MSCPRLLPSIPTSRGCSSCPRSPKPPCLDDLWTVDEKNSRHLKIPDHIASSQCPSPTFGAIHKTKRHPCPMLPSSPQVGGAETALKTIHHEDIDPRRVLARHSAIFVRGEGVSVPTLKTLPRHLRHPYPTNLSSVESLEMHVIKAIEPNG